MKSSILISAIAASGLLAACATPPPVVSAQEQSAPAKPAMSMDMDKQMSQMQESMRTMQQQMEKIRATTDPQERQKLMQEHMQAMQENMKAMRGMGGPMMMGSGEHEVLPPDRSPLEWFAVDAPIAASPTAVNHPANLALARAAPPPSLRLYQRTQRLLL